MSHFKTSLISFLKTTFNLRTIIQAVVIAFIVLLFTNYWNGFNERRNNFNRLIKELEWNLSELKQFDAFLENLEISLNNRKSLSIESRTVVNPIFPFPLRYSTQFYLKQESTEQKDYDSDMRVEPQSRNYVISELSKNGFLYNVQRKKDIKYLENMSNANWLKDIMDPVKEILSMIDDLPDIKGYSSKKRLFDIKKSNEAECEKILLKINSLREVSKSDIKQIEEIISHINDL